MLPQLLTLVAASLITSLAAATVARLVTKERGPFRIFVALRELFDKLINLGEIGQELHRLVSCPYCLSVWFCIIGALVFQDFWIVLVAPVLAWIWLECSGTPDEPDNSR